MALSASFKVAEHIEEAFERIGFAPTGLGPQHITSAKRSIRLMLQAWNNDSVDFWKVLSNQQHTQTIGEASFTPVAGTIDILDMAVLRDQTTTPMIMISRSDWFAIPDKAVVQGMANRCWLERINSGFVAHIYPYAENSTDILVYDAMVRFNDSVMLNAAADIPPLWEEAFTAGLARYLAEKFKPERLDEKMALYGGPGIASGAYHLARQGNRERGDTVMVVHKGRRTRR